MAAVEARQILRDLAPWMKVMDALSAIEYGKQLRNALRSKNMNVEWHGYQEGGHWVYEPRGIGTLLLSHQQPQCYFELNRKQTTW